MSYYRDKKYGGSGLEGGKGGKRKFSDSIEAFQSVLEEKGTSLSSEGAVSKIEVGSGYAKNGVEYCSVQISCRDGAGYHVEAFGDEARELCIVSQGYAATWGMSEPEIGARRLIPMPIVS
jgi:hypothetical protein